MSGARQDRAGKRTALAFSGGLDTSYCAHHLQEAGHEVVTVTVDTGGFDEAERTSIAERAKKLGVAEHRMVDGRGAVFDRVVGHLIRGNVLKGEVYPLCVAAERVVQAEEVVRVARETGCTAVAHGSTGAGNDQVRFDIAFSVLAQDIECLAPIRDLAMERTEQAERLRARGIPVTEKTSTFSINQGLWGTTVGGGEIHDGWTPPPPEAYPMTASPEGTDLPGAEEIAIGFERGLPVSLDGEPLSGIDSIERLNALGARHGFGRGIHVGETVLGIKGRIAFEAPAPLLLIAAHRELEKLVLTGWQQHWKGMLGDVYGKFLHEGLFFEPLMRDLEAMFESSQRHVSGDVRIRLHRGRSEVTGARSPHSLLGKRATYGERSSLWDAADAKGFARILGMASRLAEGRSGASGRGMEGTTR